MRGSWIVLCLFLLIAGYLHAAEKPKEDALFEVIHSRKSVRNFTGAPTSKGALDKILRAGMAAPSARNQQPWSFIAITDRKKLEALASRLPSGKVLQKAGAAIIVCTEPEKAAGKSREFAVIDATLASENILLAVEALGLGAVWTAVYPDASLMEHVRSQLGIPSGVIPLNVIPVGVPTGEDQPKDKYKVEKVHWEKW